jgi:hypothetical protein
MGGECGTHGRDGNSYRILVGDIGVNGRIILRRILEEWDYEDVDWIQLAQDRHQCQALVNTIMNLWVP